MGGVCLHVVRGAMASRVISALFIGVVLLAPTWAWAWPHDGTITAEIGFALVQADDGPSAGGVGRLTQGFALDMLRTVRRVSIRGFRFLRRGVRYSAIWTLTVVCLLLAGALASAIDLRLVALWRERGARLASEYALIGMIVFFRLLL